MKLQNCIRPKNPQIVPAVTTEELISSFKDLFFQNGFMPPVSIIPDGKIYRFTTKAGDNEDTAGWYFLLIDGNLAYGVIGDWRTGKKIYWSSKTGTTLKDPIDIARFKQIMLIAEQGREAEMTATAAKAKKLYETAPEATNNHPYLMKKKVPAIGIKESEGKLFIPLFNEKLEIVSGQFIFPDGKKSFMPKGRTKGCFYYLSPVAIEGAKRVFLTEGYATGASVMMATNAPVFIAFSAGQLSNCVNSINTVFPGHEIIVIADNDESGRGEEEAKKTGCRYLLIPEVGMDANDYANSGHDLKAFIDDQLKEREIKDITLRLQEPKPVQWLVKHILPRETFAMIVGAPASGKTYFVIDLLLSIATAQPEWNGKKVHSGIILYLCGEGENEINIRVRSWEISHKTTIPSKVFYTLEKTFDFDQPEGYKYLTNEIEALDIKPDVICFDTLNRYFSGNENDASESRHFINNAKELQTRFNTTIIVIHHTGRSENAKDRARGSSAWDGAADVILSAQNEEGILIVYETKLKAARRIIEPLLFQFNDIALPIEWNDEDGEITVGTYLTSTKTSNIKGGSNPLLPSDIDEIKAVLADARLRNIDTSGLWFTKQGWQMLLREKGWSQNQIKNFFRLEAKRPFMRLISNKIISVSNEKIFVTSPDLIAFVKDILEGKILGEKSMSS